MDGITNYKLLKRIFLVRICLEDGMFLWTTISEFLAIGFQYLLFSTFTWLIWIVKADGFCNLWWRWLVWIFNNLSLCWWFSFFFQLFEDVLGIEEICLALHSYLVLGISFLPLYRSMTLENVHYKCNCFHEESNFFFWQLGSTSLKCLVFSLEIYEMKCQIPFLPY